jgi:hypothetical protein
MINKTVVIFVENGKYRLMLTEDFDKHAADYKISRKVWDSVRMRSMSPPIYESLYDKQHFTRAQDYLREVWEEDIYGN